MISTHYWPSMKPEELSLKKYDFLKVNFSKLTFFILILAILEGILKMTVLYKNIEDSRKPFTFKENYYDYFWSISSKILKPVILSSAFLDSYLKFWISSEPKFSNLNLGTI